MNLPVRCDIIRGFHTQPLSMCSWGRGIGVTNLTTTIVLACTRWEPVVAIWLVPDQELAFSKTGPFNRACVAAPLAGGHSTCRRRKHTTSVVGNTVTESVGSWPASDRAVSAILGPIGPDCHSKTTAGEEKESEIIEKGRHSRRSISMMRGTQSAK
jgi:hypothetical protein